jgi:hypothetical protein
MYRIDYSTAGEEAKTRMEIARLRSLAGWQRGGYAQSHYRQASHPIYPGQDMVCLRKAKQAERLADNNDARADLLEAQIKEIHEI